MAACIWSRVVSTTSNFGAPPMSERGLITSANRTADRAIARKGSSFIKARKTKYKLFEYDRRTQGVWGQHERCHEADRSRRRRRSGLRVRGYTRGNIKRSWALIRVFAL